MSDNRKMSAKGFLHKANLKAGNSASAFLLAHREWLTTGEIASITTPILARVDAKEIMPTPALQEIKNAVFNHMIASEIRKAEKAIEKAQEPGATKDHVAVILDENGKIATRINAQGNEYDLVKSFDMPQEAMRWIVLRLIEAAPRSYATLDHVKTVQQETISRDDAFAIEFKAKRGPIMKAHSKTTDKLGFGVKASQDHASFSRG